MPSSPSTLVNKSTNLSDIESGQTPLLTCFTKQTRHLERVQRVHDEYSYSSTSTREESLKDIIIGNIPIEEEESSESTGISIIISASIQANSVISEPSLVATNKSFFSKPTGRTEANVLAHKVIVPKNLRGTAGTHEHET